MSRFRCKWPVFSWLVWPIFLLVTAWAPLPILQGGDRAEASPETLPSNPLSEALAKHVGITWLGNPLRAGFDRLGVNQEVTIFLDRRVDPGTLISCTIEQTPLEDALREIAAQHRLGVGMVGPVIYVGPPRVASTVATVTALRRREAMRLSGGRGQALLTRRKAGWPDLSEPRWLVKKMVAEVGCELSNPDTIPHDLWRACELPPVNFVERMTLVLTGFQLTYQLDSDQRTIRLTPYPHSASIEHVYDPPGDVNGVADRLGQSFPQAYVNVEGARLRVQTTVEDHWQIAARIRGAKESSTGSAESSAIATKVYTLQIEEKPLGPLLDILARRLNLEITYAGELNAALAQRVSFVVKKVTAKQLIETAVSKAGLIAEFNGDAVTISQSPQN